MAYRRTVWQDDLTPVNAFNLNNIEEGLSDVDKGVTYLTNNINKESWYSPKNIKGTGLGTDGIPSSYTPENYEKFYDWALNKLVNSYPEYITKEKLGMDQSNTYSIYKYEFTPKKYEKTILVLGCVHGNEYTSFYGLCRFLQEVCNNYNHDSILNFIRNKIKLVVVPIVNPWGFINGKRQNSRGVDLNRNNDYLWDEYNTSSSQIDQPYYKGESVFSEKETQILRDLCESIKNDKLVASVDLHTLTTIDATKVIYYPRYFDNNLEGLQRIVKRFDTEASNNNEIFAGSNLPTFSNYASKAYNIFSCNPEWNNAIYDKVRSDLNMRKYVEWIGNIILCYATSNNSMRNDTSGPFTKYLIWDKEANSKGYTIIRSDNLNILKFSEYDFYLTRAYNASLTGTVKIVVTKPCTITLDPLFYCKNSKGQGYSEINKDIRFSHTITLEVGEYIIPINAVIKGYFANYNDQNSSRTDYVRFRLRAKTDVLASAYITSFKVIFNFTPTDLGKSLEVVRVNDLGEKTLIYPDKIPEDLND